MLKSIEGIYHEGQIKLLETPPAGAEGKVIVTFLTPNSINLAEQGIDMEQAADLRQRLKPFAEDWDRPEMDAYDAI